MVLRVRISGQRAACCCLLGLLANVASVSSYFVSSPARLTRTTCRSVLSATPYFVREIDGPTSANSDKTVIVAGATGYIGRAVVEESVKRGYNTVALVRSKAKLETDEGIAAYRNAFAGAIVMECDVENPAALNTLMAHMDIPVDTVISCLASPIGTKKEAYAIDYQASLNCLDAGAAVNARHFVLLSAFCCRRPLLQLQQAKLKLEAKLQEQSQLTYSIIRPTAFFKSVSGQLEAIQGGAPYVLFGDGAVTRCNPIAECELAEFMLDSLTNPDKCNKILNVGGPDEPLTNKMLGQVSLLLQLQYRNGVSLLL
jgi:divinyl chlorophyllide a 8-vinyl-reductase